MVAPADGVGVEAGFFTQGQAATTDGTTLFLGERAHYGCIRKVDLASREVTSLVCETAERADGVYSASKTYVDGIRALTLNPGRALPVCLQRESRAITQRTSGRTTELVGAVSGYLDSTSVTALVATAERLFATTSTLIHPDDSYGRTSCSLYLDSNGLYSNGCGLCPDAVTVPDALKNDGTCNALKCSLVSWSMADLLPGGGLATAARDTLIDRTCGTQDGAAGPGGSASIMYVTGMTVVDSSIYMSDFYSGGVRLLADGVVSTLLDGEGNTGDDISARDPSASPYGDTR